MLPLFSEISMETFPLEEMVLRELRDGDIASIVDLFNTTFEGYGGFVPRTIAYWTWACYQRPDVTVDGIRVASQSGKVVGYIVVGKSGNVWDLCYDTRLPEGEAIVYQLISWALYYVKKISSNYIQLNFPADNKTVRRVCEKLGFSSSPSEYMFVSILDLPNILCASLKNKNAKQINCLVEFRIKNASVSGETKFTFEIKNGQISEVNSTVNADISIEADAKALISFIFSGGSILKALATSRVRFHPYSKIWKGMQLLSLFQNNSPWFMPRADIG
jgi:hypothetical protein